MPDKPDVKKTKPAPKDPAPKPPPAEEDDRASRFVGGPEDVQVKGGTVTL